MKILKCNLCGKELLDLEEHDYPYTACDECFDIAGTPARFIEMVKDRVEMKQELVNAAAIGLAKFDGGRYE